MKAIMTVTCFMGKNTKSVSPSTHKKGKKKGIETRTSGPGSVHTSACQTTTHFVVRFERHSLKKNTISTWPSNCLPFLSPPPPRFSCYFLSQGPLWWAAILPKAVISCLQLEGVCMGTGPATSLCGFQPKSCHPHWEIPTKNDFRVCSPEQQGCASSRTPAGRLEVKTLRIGA